MKIVAKWIFSLKLGHEKIFFENYETQYISSNIIMEYVKNIKSEEKHIWFNFNKFYYTLIYNYFFRLKDHFMIERFNSYI